MIQGCNSCHANHAPLVIFLSNVEFCGDSSKELPGNLFAQRGKIWLAKIHQLQNLPTKILHKKKSKKRTSAKKKYYLYPPLIKEKTFDSPERVQVEAMPGGSNASSTSPGEARDWRDGA